MLKSIRLPVLAISFCVALAQSPEGTITGTVTDTQGGRVAGVKVSVLRVDTNLVYTGTSSEEGTYVIPSVPPGVVRISASHPGFRSFARDNVLVEVAQTLRVDISLEVGEVKETVTVKSDVVRVQMEESSLSTVVENQRIEELPLDGRNVFSLLTIVAGVVPRLRDNDGFADQDVLGVRVNGGPTAGNQIYMDGATNLTTTKGMSVVPQADSVQEFRVETNSMKAEYGNTSGGVVTVATKSGTNKFHGTLYEFFRNDVLDARNAFSTVPDASGRLKPITRYNQFGGTIGGPVMIPKAYDGHNKTFFYFGHEQWLYSNASIMRATLPTALERAGDFTNTRDAKGALISAYDPNTTRANPSGNGFVRDPYPGNKIPSNQIDPVSRNILNYVPLPDVPADNPYTDANNWLFLGSSPLNEGTTSIKIDHRFTDRDNVFFRYSYTRQTRIGHGYGFGVADPNGLARNDQRNRHNAAFSAIHVFTPTLINEFRANISRFYLDFKHMSYGQGWPQKLGLPDTVPPDLFPSLSITGVTVLGPGSLTVGLQGEHTVQFVDAVTWIKGRHTIKIGTDQRFSQSNFIRTLYPSGQYTFTTTLTSNPQQSGGTGVGMATFLAGAVTGGQLYIEPSFSFAPWQNGSYIQDDWKVTPHLTLNIGMRYDINSPARERWNRSSDFDPYIMNPETKLMGALVYAGATAPQNMVNWDRNNAGPRFGFAYALGGKTVLRGGYGILYVPVDAGNSNPDNANALGFEAITTFSSSSTAYPAFLFKNGPPAILQPQGAAGGPSAFRGQNVLYQNPNAPAPYLQQWNLTLQRQIKGGWLVSTSYTGNHGVKLFGLNYDLNQLDPAYFSLGLKLQNAVPNPFYGQVRTGGLSGPTISLSQSLTPYPDYTQVATFANHGSASTYHSLQITIEKRYSNGLSGLIAYTDSKLIDDSDSMMGTQSSTLDDQRLGRFNRHLDKAVDGNDVSQRLVASGIYQLPVGHGKRILGQAHGVQQQFLGGWQANTVTTIQSGSPLIVRGASNFTGISFPNLLHSATLPPSQRSVNEWFDTSAFMNPPNFTVGNAPRTLPDTRGPGMFNMNVSAFKVFSLKERIRLEFRGEFFNFLNHVNLNPPGVSFTTNTQGFNNNSSFGKITSAMNARRSQLALRLVF